MKTYLDSLCNRSLDGPFWDDRATILTQDPRLTLCFQHTALDWIPCAWLLLSLPYQLYTLSTLPTYFRFWAISNFNIVKVALTLTLAIVCFLNIVKYVAEASAGVALRGGAFVLSPILQFISLIYVAVNTHSEFRKGINSSGPLFLYWFMYFITTTIQIGFESKDSLPYADADAYANVTLESYKPVYYHLDSFRHATLVVSYVLVVLLAFLHLFADNKCLYYVTKHADDELTPIMHGSLSKARSTFSLSRGRTDTPQRNLCPEIFAPFILRRTYWWFSKMTLTGFKRTLTLDDCWDLIPQYRSNSLVPTIIDCWQKQVKQAVNKQRAYALTHPTPVYAENGSFHLAGGMENPLFEKQAASTPIAQNAENLLCLRMLQSPRETKKKYNPSLIAAVWGVIGPLYLLNAFLKVVYDLLTFVQPVLLDLLVAVVVGTDPIQWHGYVIAGAMFGVGAVRSLLLSAHFHTGMMCSLKARTALTGLVYRKALLLSTSGKKDSTVGEIVNLMSVDVQRVQDTVSFLNLIWSSPLVITIALIMLYVQLGPAAFAGLAVMVLLIPLNMVIATRMKKFQAQQMKLKDERIKLSTEILNGMKVLKLYGWETAYLQVVGAIRLKEVANLKRIAILNAFMATAVFIAPFLVAACSFIVYTVISPTNVLTPNIVSVSLSLINIMNMPISYLPNVVAYVVQTSISVNRLRDYLLKDEILPNSVTHDFSAREPVQIRGTFSWGRDEPPLLKDVNVTVADSSIIAVVGAVGSGKSSLLHALLGEMHKLKGEVVTRGSVAYVPQQAWIINASIQDNIVFGMEFNKQKYDRVVQACALEPDFKIMPNGDQTEVGERGINMSGGQKQRISLARAVYQNSDIYVLDDPLSAVDSHVAKHIFEQVLGPSGLLACKTRILVTHAVNILPKMDQIVVMKAGEIVESGTFDHLLQQNKGFAEFIREFLLEEESDDDDEDAESVALKKTLMRQVSKMSGDEGEGDGKGSVLERRTASVRNRKSDAVAGTLASRRSRSSKAAQEKPAVAPQLKLIQDELSQVGSVKWQVYAMYIRALTLSLAIGALGCYLLYIAGGVGTNIWLSIWSADAIENSNSRDLVYMRMGVYVAFGATQMFAILTHTICIAFATTKASRILHESVFGRIMRSPMSFFDTTPIGRITNRISKDLDTMDLNFPMTLRQWLIHMAVCFQTIVLIAISNSLLIIMLIPVIILFCIIQRFYINTSRQLKRIDSVLRSPIFAHFQNSLLGLTSIRAYKITDRFSTVSDELVDRSQTVFYPQCVSFRWLGVSLDSLSNIMILVVGMVSTASSSIGFDASLASLAVTYTTTMTNSLTMAVRSMTDLETYVVSIERLKEYAELDVEAPLEEPDSMFIPKDWPSNGKVEFSNYSVRYRAGLDLVLRDINCTIKPCEKVGIVGRTGAGKSSLSLALFRILEPAQGTIIVDGVDITRLGLQTLRSRVTIIPQEPVLFSGSLRRNIDPFGLYSDDKIWQALECSHLKAFVQAQPAGLDFVCSEGGENLSVGQRQLVCMARAVLRRSKILLLDEATAAVDVETDQLIQKTIRDEFKDCTILTIAHRLNTVLDYDKIMVLDQGRIKEYDSPKTLLNDKLTIFYSMAKDAGLVHD